MIRIEDQTKSASDFSIIIERYPIAVSQESLQGQLNTYF